VLVYTCHQGLLAGRKSVKHLHLITCEEKEEESSSQVGVSEPGGQPKSMASSNNAQLNSSSVYVLSLLCHSLPTR